MQIAIISDTHLPRGARRLPDPCLERCRAADLIIHAGDFVRVSVLRDLEELGRVAAVHGNVDESRLRALLPERTIVQVGAVRIGVVHDAGPAQTRSGRLRTWFSGAQAAVFGHSHIPVHETGDDGFQMFNPGSPTERRWAPRHTMGIADVAGSSITLSLIDLD